MTPHLVRQMRLDVRRALTELTEQLDVTEAEHDDVAALLLEASELLAMAKEMQAAVNARVLEWLRGNAAGADAVTIGEKRYAIDRAPRTKLRDVKATAAALVPLVCPQIDDLALRATRGELERAADVAEEFAVLVGDFAASVVSSQGLKAGACKQYLGAAFDLHWETTWPTENEQKLAVKNTRFQKGKAP